MWTEEVFRPGIESKILSKGNPDFGIIPKHGFTAAVDFPMALYYEEINEQYPDCKFVLTTRKDSEVWFKSWNTMAINIAETTNIGANLLKHVNQLSHYVRWLFAMVENDPSILSIPIGEPIPNPTKHRAISTYEEHNRRVREVIPADRLLEYDVSQGWEPLCKFLEVESCPEIPFPKTNTALSLKVQNISSVLIPLSIVLFILFSAFAHGFERLTGKKVLPWLDFRWKRFKWSMRNSGKMQVKKNM